MAAQQSDHPRSFPAMPVAASELQYERQDPYAQPMAAQSSTMPTIALWMGIIHAAVAVGLATLLGIDAFDHVHNVEAVVFLLVGLIPTGAPTVVLGVIGHRYPGGRRKAGPAMWIAGLVPAGAALLMLAVGVATGDPSEEGIRAVYAVVVVDLLIVFGLRNRILKEHRGPLPVIPIPGYYDESRLR